MRKVFKLILIFFFFITQYSCDDWLDIIPPNGLYREEFYQVKEDVESVMMAAYSKFATLDRELFLHGELRGDLLDYSQNNQNQDEIDIMQSNIYPDNPYCDWGTFYSVINYCNEVVKNAPLVQEIDETYTEFQMKSIVAEAIFLRSLTYFYLVRIYKDVPFITDPVETDESDVLIKKSSEEEVLSSIVSDLKMHRIAAPSGGFSTIAENKGRASRAAIDALLADIELWRFNYDEVIKHVQRIKLPIEPDSPPPFELMPSLKWFEIFYPGNSLESIFEIQYSQSLNQPNGLTGMMSRFFPQYVPSETTIELYTKSAEKVRGLNNTIARYGTDNYGIWKYIGQSTDGRNNTRSGSEYSSANFVIYRLADVLLMEAEARSQNGDFNGAREILHQIQTRADVPLSFVSDSRTAFEDAILEERARELAFEGKRWFDLLRLGRRNNFERKNNLIDILVQNARSTQKRILTIKLSNPLGWYLPVYQEQLERNINMEQNPYYDN